MDRETRKANLRKLQLPGSGAKTQRKTRQSVKTPGTSISNYFPTAENTLKLSPDKQETPKDPPDKNDKKHENETKPKTTRAKRTKLDAFVFKQPQTIPTDLKAEQQCANDDDFDVPEKKAKKAPQPPNTDNTKTKAVKPSRRKKQTTIKSAFLRNEQLFAEIAAQHCAADNFDGDDVQLAIAISKSEAESKGVVVVDDNGTNDVVGDLKDGDEDAELIRQKLKKYGFRTAEKKDYSTFTAAFMPKPAKGRRQKTKWANKFTALTLRDEQVQNKKLLQKIEATLNQQFCTKPLKAEEGQLSNYLFLSKLLKKCHKENKEKILENPDDLQKPHENYFVTDLFEISKLPPGHLLKNWTAIQGRDLTPKKLGPYKEAMTLKLRKSYADLEAYFTSLKASNMKNDSSVEEEANVNDNTNEELYNENQTTVCNNEIVKTAEDSTSNKTDNQYLSHSLDIKEQNIGNDYFKTLHYEDDVEGTLDSGSSLTSSIRNEIISIIPPAKSLDLMQISNTSIHTTEATTFHSTQTSGSNSSQETAATSGSDTSIKNHIRYILPSTKDLDAMQVSSTSIRTEATFNSSQKTRSNSPDLFADSDEEMEEDDNIGKGAEDVNNLSVNRGSSSLDNVAGVTTYEIYSSDEVKNTASSEPTDNLAVEDQHSSSQNMEEENVIDLTQDDGGEESMRVVLNQSKPIVEVDLFADSPLHEESELETDINSNSQKSKYLLNNREETFNFSLSLEGSGDATNPALGKGKEDTFKFTLSMECDGMQDCEDEDDVVFKEVGINQTNSSLLNLQVLKQLEARFHTTTDQETYDANLSPEKNREDIKTLSKQSEGYYECEDDGDVVFRDIAIKQSNLSFLNIQGPKQLETSLNREMKTSKVTLSPDNIREGSLQLSQNMETERQHENEEDDDDDDVVLREIEINQTNTSFLNFQGPRQLETSFHRKTAIEPAVSHRKRSIAGNDTIFQELYKKYLGSGATTQEQKSCLANESVLRTSFTQILPKAVTPKNDTYFSMDLEMTMEQYLNNRKSLSFNAASPEKVTFPSNAGLSKSQSFTEQNVSIDLTQNEDDVEEEEDDCLVLSDDEINYSIWKANKTGKFKDSDENSESEDDAISMGNRSTEKTNLNYLPTHISKPDHDPSLLDKLNKELLRTPKKSRLSQHSYSDFELKSPKTNDREHELERSNFGILEEFSEPIDFTPNLSTPTKLLEEASFLQSPTELTAPMKRYSNGYKSAQKFNDLLKTIDNETEPYNNFDEYDEFDCMIYQNLVKTNTSATELPQDFDQLMTAEISFKESHEKFPNSKSHLPKQIDISEQAASASSTISKARTPTKFLIDQQELTINNKTYTIRSDEAPRPNYAQYSEAELLKELYNYGIKPLKRKQAVKMLEYIYLQTHPIIVDEPSKDIDNFDLPSTSKSSLKSKITIPMSSQDVPVKTITPEPSGITACGDNKLNLHDGCGLDMLRYSFDLKAELFDEQYILQTNVTKKTLQPLMPFHIAWYNLVCSNRKLHENILMYEPIDLQEIYLFLKGLGYRYDPKDLKQFFDRRCIIFRYDLATAGSNGNKVKENNRHVRKKKTTTSRRKQTVAVNIT